MNQKKLILAVALSILVLCLILFVCLRVGKKSVPKTESGRGEAANSIADLLPIRQMKKSSYEGWGRDPFLVKEFVVDKLSVLVLDGIAWDEKSPKAIISDHIVGIGDRVDGKVVVKIERNQVTLKDGANDIKLKLKERRESF